MNITHNHFSDRAQRTITAIDQKAAQAARMCKDNPDAAIMFLGELRGKIEGLRSDVRTVAAERDACMKLAREAMDLPPHPADGEPLVPVSNLELSIEEMVRAEYEQQMDLERWNDAENQFIQKEEEAARRYEEQYADWE